ncbi:hypothetical protein MKW98_005088 [Papaver atlanticum]|uniref:Uncharacterized protein n=1 Tax=Papaver atlanticum TaxID=357466 RepID=A0AAD4XFJ5_9MAGN|nr:hypothetical protein MKW98_005088 [Papaver atlanticum]
MCCALWRQLSSMVDESSAQEASTSTVIGESSDPIVEFNVKTLDSFQVEKNMPVPLFREKIAGTIDVPDGDTLRLVVTRQNQFSPKLHLEQLLERQMQTPMGKILMGAANTSSSVPPNATNQASQDAETEGTRGNVAGRGGKTFPNQPFQSLA